MSYGLHIRQLMADEPAFDIVARWRYDAFFAQEGGGITRHDMRLTKS